MTQTTQRPSCPLIWIVSLAAIGLSVSACGVVVDQGALPGDNVAVAGAGGASQGVETNERLSLLERVAPGSDDPFQQAAPGGDAPRQSADGGANGTPSPEAGPGPNQGQSFQTTSTVPSLRLTPSVTTLHTDAATVFLGIVAEDATAARVAGVLVLMTLEGDSVPLETAQCTTGPAGTCFVEWVAPASAFDVGGALNVTAVVGLTQATAALTVFPTPAALAINRPGMGLQLPTSPRAEGTEFSAPVYVETLGTTAGAYDLRVDFDAAALEIVDVTAGACAAFGAPVFNEIQSGRLLLNGINTDTFAACGDAERVHVASVTFRVRTGAGVVGVAAVTCTIKDLYDTNFNHLAENKPCNLADAMGTGDAGEVLVSAQ